jgi:uncharacterized membrane protein
MVLGSLLITLASLVYFDSDTLAPFVIEKLPVRLESLWLTSLKVHVASALLSFPLCLLLTTRFLQRARNWHRWLGRTTGLCVVFALVPSGFVLAFEAKGGAPVTLGFLLSGTIVLWAMISGVVAARKRRVAAHARAMRHVVAQMSVAVTSRALLIGLDLAGMQPDVAYVVALWVPVIGSTLIAEWASGQFRNSALAIFTPNLRNQP